MHIFPKQGGEKGTATAQRKGDGAVLEYRVIQCASRTAAIAAGHTARPATILQDGVPLVYDKIDATHVEADVWDVSVSYVARAEQSQSNQQQSDPPEWSFDASVAQTHVTHGIKVRQAFPTINPMPNVFGGAINVETSTKGALTVRGLDVEVPQLKFTLRVKIPQPANPPEFARELARRTAKTNSQQWYGFRPTEVLFLGGRLAGKLTDVWTLDYTFAASEQSGFEVPDLGFCEKRGFDYFWIHYVPRVVDGLNGKEIKPLAVYAFSHQIYEEFDFRELGIGG